MVMADFGRGDLWGRLLLLLGCWVGQPSSQLASSFQAALPPPLPSQKHLYHSLPSLPALLPN